MKGRGWECNSSDTQEATIAPLPLTMHPQSWVEPHIHVHVHAGKSLPSVPPSSEDACNICNPVINDIERE